MAATTPPFPLTQKPSPPNPLALPNGMKGSKPPDHRASAIRHELPASAFLSGPIQNPALTPKSSRRLDSPTPGPPRTAFFGLLSKSGGLQHDGRVKWILTVAVLCVLLAGCDGDESSRPAPVALVAGEFRQVGGPAPGLTNRSLARSTHTVTPGKVP